ncbi:hypothetical protein OV208_21480 [Corallococcus sp. bb12-1]|uniref:hypothetical protein n=1 Tax=Corallococcus sp. bb12-1 TaxID=2996784 RepID=UPI0022711F0C|nr:hypothetical protein [Corallococcus sp. bb12-1]MCY1043903.1 hypothetical protein [Corallococcus sp. bb12-1]
MSKIGEGRPGVSAPKQQPTNDKAATKTVSAQQLANLFGSLTSASASPAKPVTATSAKQAMVATPAMTAALAQPMAATREVLPNLLAPLTDPKMNECFDKAFNEVYQGTKLPSGKERTEMLAFATKLREKQPDITAADLREALVGELRKRRDGGDVVTPAKIQKYVEEAVSWTATCYEGGARSPTPSEMAEWTAFANQQMKDNPEMTPDQLSAAIMDAVRDKATGMSSGGSGAKGKVNVDKFIQDAVSWSSNVYQGGSRSATAAELQKWRAFADKTMADNPDMTPSQLSAAIMDAVRDDMTGVGGPPSQANVDKFINDAVSWAAKVYQGTDRGATSGELQKWRAFADKTLADNPDMTSAQLQAAIQDAVRDEVTGVSSGSGGANLDKIINDAVSWAAKVYQGGERGATPAELTKWKEFAKKKLEDNPGMTPSQLSSAIQDAVRDDMRGVGGPAESAPLERFVKDAFKWVFELYMNQPTDKPREPTAREIRDWSNYAKEQLKKNPDLTAEDLQSVIQDGLRRALGNM